MTVDTAAIRKRIRASHSVIDALNLCNALDEARTERDEYKRETFHMAADQCHDGYPDEYWHHRCREVDAANARAERAEALLREARDALETFMPAVAKNDNSICV